MLALTHHVEGGAQLDADAFVALNLRSILGSLSDLKSLCEKSTEDPKRPDRCREALVDALAAAMKVVEVTRKTFGAGRETTDEKREARRDS